MLLPPPHRSSWLPTRLFKRTSRRRKRVQTFAVCGCESLEHRTLLSAFVVNSMADTVDANPGDGSAQDAGGNTTLRAAIMEANALAGDDMITLGAGTFTLTIGGTAENSAATGDLDITDQTGSLTIIGAGVDNTIIDAAAIDRVFEVLAANVVLNLSGLTVTGGSSASPGGGNRSHLERGWVSNSSFHRWRFLRHLLHVAATNRTADF